MDQNYYPVISRGNIFALTYISTAWHMKTCGQIKLNLLASKELKTEVSIILAIVTV